jgi:hypothetical protein
MAKELKVKVGLDSSAFFAGLKTVQSQLASTSGTIGRIGSSIRGQLAGAFAVTGLTALVKTTIDAGSRIFDLAQRLNLTTGSVQKLDFAAQQSGTNIDTLAKAIQRVALNVSEAAGGNKNYQDALRGLGLSAGELVSLAPDELLVRLSRAFNETANRGEATNNIFRLVGKSAGEIIPLLSEGEAGLRRLFETAPQIADPTIRKLKQLGDELNRLKFQLAPVTSDIVALGAQLGKSGIFGLTASGAGLAAAVTAPFIGLDRATAALDAVLSESKRNLTVEPPSFKPGATTGDGGPDGDARAANKLAALREQQDLFGIQAAQALEIAKARLADAEVAFTEALRGGRDTTESLLELEQRRLELMQAQKAVRDEETQSAANVARAQERLEDAERRSAFGKADSAGKLRIVSDEIQRISDSLRDAFNAGADSETLITLREQLVEAQNAFASLQDKTEQGLTVGLADAVDTDQFSRVGLFASGGSANAITNFMRSIADAGRRTNQLLAGTLKVETTGPTLQVVNS